MSKKKSEKPKIVVPGPQNSARLGTPGDKPQKTASQLPNSLSAMYTNKHRMLIEKGLQCK